MERLLFMPTYRGGRHEHGQNFLTDNATIQQLVRLVRDTAGPIVEIGPGRGHVTQELANLERPLTAVEIDGNLAHRLHADLELRARDNTTVVNADFLQWRLPDTPHVVVGNVPFHITTAILRKLLHHDAWTRAILLVQWEVARRRAGIGGASMMTAQWWPWIDFSVHGRVPRSAFKPAPNVDGGLLQLTRRAHPLLLLSDRTRYRQFVHAVFTRRGRGIGEILPNASTSLGRRDARGLLRNAGVPATALPKDLTASQWVQLFVAMPRETRVGKEQGRHTGGSARRRGR